MILFQENFAAAARAIKSARAGDLVLLTLRHGESLGQKNIHAYRQLGDDALPITRRGVEQSIAAAQVAASIARQAGLWDIDIRTSTGRRSETTASIMQRVMGGYDLNVTMFEDTRLDKQKFGKFDGFFTSAERAANCPEAYEYYVRHEKPKGPFHACPPGGESIADVQARHRNFIHELIENPVPTIVVTHGTNTLCIENILMGHGEQWVLDNVDKRPNCSINIIRGNKRDGFTRDVLIDDPRAWQRAKIHEHFVRPPHYGQDKAGMWL